MAASPKLPLTDEERRYLRRAGIRLIQIADMQPQTLSTVLQTSLDRATKVVALASFQRIPDIGPAMAQMLVRLGFTRLEQLKGRNPAQLLDALEMSQGYWTDPCVEDEIRLAVHYAEHPDAHKRWWDFTVERKAYRASHGYPATRPKKGWNEAASPADDEGPGIGKWTGSAACCVNAAGQVLMVLQGKPDEVKRWSVPSGGIERGETFEECCCREVREETGYEVSIELELFVKRGQSYGLDVEVHYFWAKVIAGESRIDDPDGLIHDVSWKSADELTTLNLAFPEDRELLIGLTRHVYPS